MGRARTVMRKSTIVGLYVCARRLDIIKFDKNSTDLYCFIFQFERAWSFVWRGISPPKPPVATGLGRVRI